MLTFVAYALIALLSLSLMAGANGVPEAISHLEYVVVTGAIYVYDMDNGFSLVKTLALAPTERTNIKGVAASPASGMLYVSYGGDGGTDGFGSLLKYDLRADQILWARQYSHGVDSMALNADASLLFMPVGEEEKTSQEWKVLDAGNGDEVGSLSGGFGPHNTVLGVSGTRVYLGGREDDYLSVRDTSDGRLVSTIGPFLGTVRPFTVNSDESLVFTTHTGFLGFQVGRVSDGAVLFTVRLDGFNSQSEFSTPSHGISLAPDEREIYLIDTANALVHVFDVSALPDAPPVRVASIKLSQSFEGKERGCGTGWCGRISWLQHSLDGHFVMVGNAGDVIDTRTRQVIAHLPPLRETRKMLEIDWADGVPVSASPREGLGYRRP